jgi:hypothetical protein
MRAAAACAGVHRLELGAEPLLISDGAGLYPLRTACVWVLRAAAPIRLVFRSFFTEEDYDVLNVYDGAGEAMQPISELSGSRLPAPIVSNGTVLTLTFTSDAAVRYSGFELFASSLAADGTWPLTPAPARPPDPRTPLPAVLVLPAIGAGARSPGACMCTTQFEAFVSRSSRPRLQRDWRVSRSSATRPRLL